MSEDPTLEAAANGTSSSEDWKTDVRGRQYTGARGRSGQIYRQGEETVDQAHERVAKQPPDQKPKRKTTTKKAPAPTALDLRELEKQLIDALCLPAFIFAANGDEWGVTHVTTEGPKLARNMVKCAEHDPWLREKLIALAAGEGAMQRVMLYGYLGASVFSYTVPMIVRYVNPPLPERFDGLVREHYRIPDTPVFVQPLEQELDFAASAATPGAESPEPAVL